MPVDQVKTLMPASGSAWLGAVQYTHQGQTVDAVIYVNANGVVHLVEAWPDGTVLEFKEYLK